MIDLTNIIENNNGFLFIVFISSDCDYCNNIIKEIQEKSEKIKIIEIDYHENHDLAEQFSIKMVPTVLIYAGNKLMDYIDGKRKIDRYLKRIDIDTESKIT